MKPKKGTTKPEGNRTSKDTPQIKPSILNHLLSTYHAPHEFSPQQIQEGISQFDAFVKDPKVAGLNNQEKMKVFRAKWAWTGEERKDFNIGAAIYKGWLITTGNKDALRDLMYKKRGEQGNFGWVYNYECPQCGSVDARGFTRRLSQVQYDEVPEDEALGTLLDKKEMKKCPECGEYVQFKRVRVRTESWTREQQERKVGRRRARDSRGVQLTENQMRQHCKAVDEFCDNIRKRYLEIFSNIFNLSRSMIGIEETKQKLDRLWIDAKPYMKRIYESLGMTLCARYNCLRPLPLGSRANRKYCSEGCKSVEKSRNARKK